MESILYSGAANYYRGMEAVGGKLILYPDKLHFESHGFALQPQPHTILLKDVSEIKKKNAFGIIPNGIIIVNKDGKCNSFVVYNRDVWIENIYSAIKQIAK